MKNLTRITQTMMCALMILGSAHAQDAHFTNAFAHPLKLNPGLMGEVENFKMILNYRNQWGTIDGGFQTYSFSALYPLYIKDTKEKIDFGLNATNDKEGAFNSLDFSLAVGYDLRVSETAHISFALMGGYVQKSLNTGDFTLADQSETIFNEKASYPDMGFGLMWYFNPSRENNRLSAFAGVSGFHLNEPKEIFANENGVLPRKFSVQGGLKMRGENRIDFTPNIIGTVQSGSKDFAAGAYVDYNFNELSKLKFGAWYRNKDALAFLLGVEHNGVAVAYSYDMTNSPLSRAISGLNTHEVMLSYQFRKAEDRGEASFHDSGDDEKEPKTKKKKKEKAPKPPKEKKEKQPKVKKEKAPKPPKEKKEKAPKEKKAKEPKPEKEKRDG